MKVVPAQQHDSNITESQIFESSPKGSNDDLTSFIEEHLYDTVEQQDIQYQKVLNFNCSIYKLN